MKNVQKSVTDAVLIDVKEEGKLAYWQGILSRKCPYSKGSQLEAAWKEGHREGKREDMDARADCSVLLAQLINEVHRDGGKKLKELGLRRAHSEAISLLIRELK